MRPSNKQRFLHKSIRGRSAKTIVLLSALLVIVPESVIDSQAAFTLNWQRDYSSEGASFSSDDTYVVCHMSYISTQNCGSGDTDESGAHQDGTAFLQEHLVLSGQDYYHIIVGDYTKDTMVQEYFIKASGDSYSGGGRGSIPNFSASIGDGSSDSNAEYNITNPYSTNSSLTGTGGGNPNSVIIRQVINDSGTYQEFLKDSFSNKPLMSETITDSDMSAVFSMDMRGKTYSDNTPITVANLVNTVTLTGATRFNTAGDADVQSQQDEVHLTAGAFTYTAASGDGGGGGTYTYTEPFIFTNPMNQDYAIFCKPSENPNWSGHGACTNGSGSGGGGGGSWGGGGW